MSVTLLKNAGIVTGASVMKGTLGIEGEFISGIWERVPDIPGAEVIDLDGRIVMAGAIDAHVHFREPGMTRKADIGSESYAAVLGGVTSFIDMPNTSPPATSLEAIGWKLDRASETSAANYGFHIGATNSNSTAILEYISEGKADLFGGIKVFMGSSTGDMLVDRESVLEDLFRIKGKTVLIHSEDESLIKSNLANARKEYGDNIPFEAHPLIRSREACVKSTRKAIELAIRHGTHLHILHVSTKEETELIREAKRSNPHITAETSVNYLWFSDKDYKKMAGNLKCNPAVKTSDDRDALIEAIKDGTIDTIGSDHAPHLMEEKLRPYLECPSGLPTIQQSLPAFLTIARDHGLPLTRVASALSERAAGIFGIERRGFLRPGFYADIVVINPGKEYMAGKPAYKCGWSPYEGCSLIGEIEKIWVNGDLVVSDGKPCTGTRQSRPQPLRFRSIGQDTGAHDR
ncbi:MAG: dihydroorotase [Bacteroidales bacterium]|nr:dihydroorotase [Bacteroidales bacterium]